MLGLPVKGALTEDGTDQATLVEVRLDVLKDLELGVRGGANNHDVRARHDIFGVLGALVNATGQIASALPVG